MRIDMLSILALLWAATPVAAAAPRPLEINGSTTLATVVVRAAELLRAEHGLEIRVDTQGGSSGGIAALADGRVDVAMSSRPLSPRDHARYPDVDFRAVAIGSDALALVVSRDVWEGGVRALGAEQLRAIYEGRIANWRAVGGPDRPIVFFNKEPGRGTWEVFATWLYGDANAAPLVNHPEVGSNQEARAKVSRTRGAITQLSAAWADGEHSFALGIAQGDGAPIRPDLETLASGRYPLARPLLLITDGAPDARARELIDFLRGPRGAELVQASGYEPLAGRGPDVAAPPAPAGATPP